jgi:hypothetical protein
MGVMLSSAFMFVFFVGRLIYNLPHDMLRVTMVKAFVGWLGVQLGVRYYGHNMIYMGVLPAQLQTASTGQTVSSR